MNWILNNDIVKHLLKTYLPYLIAFLMGVIVAWKGCGGGVADGVTDRVVIEKPIPKIEYVDRWKTDTVRFVSTRIVERVDTIYQNEVVNRLDTLLLIDTVKIVEAWLSEVVHYDTSALVGGGALRLRWQNYQNFSENVSIEYTPNIRKSRYAIGVHGNAGLISDFESRYVPLMGLGVQATVKKTYFSVDYGFNGQHYVGFRVGRNIISR